MRDTDKFYLYLFALLRTYGNTNTEDKSSSRADMPMFVTNTYGEYFFALLGYFYGYSTLRNFEDRISITDPVFATYFNSQKRLPIKFELITLFDYVIIESVYSNVFISNSDAIDTNFLNSTSIAKEPLIIPASTPREYARSAVEVHGKIIYQYRRKSYAEELAEIANKIPLETPVISELGVYFFRLGLPWHFSSIADLTNQSRLPFIIHFNREEILDTLKSKKVDIKELLKRIEISISYNEFK